ncbi:Sugar-transfer associated ATP-grasp [Lachnospiraceae bacterium XBB1006]|nr:Sugar-transfer associated ATP-grasp [Lachnospiraceae bacterium XBB1006]
MYVEIIAEQLGICQAEVEERIAHARKVYHIPLKYYANHRLYLADGDETLKMHEERMIAEREKITKRLSKITGWTLDQAQAYLLHITNTFHITGKEVMDSLLYEKTDEEIAAWKEEKLARAQARITRIQEKTGWSEYEVRKHMAKCKAVFGIAMANYENTRCYELTDAELSTYANLEDSRRLCEKYITVDTDVLKDKQLFNETYREFLGRDFWVNRDSDYASFKKFLRWKREVFCKPIDLFGAHGVFKKRVPFGRKKELYAFFEREPKMLVEEVIKQHPEMAAFYDGSINTVRVFTILKDDRFDAFAAFVRFGVGGIADNVSAGGIACGVDPVSGEIITPAVGNEGILYQKHPLTGKRFEGFRIPYWQEILTLTEQALRKVDGVNYVGWDVAITKRGPILVEGNNVPCLSIYQSLFAYRKEGRKFTYAKYLEE